MTELVLLNEKKLFLFTYLSWFQRIPQFKYPIMIFRKLYPLEGQVSS